MKKFLFTICIVLLVLFTACSPSKLGLYKACATNDVETVKRYYEKFPDEIGKTTLDDSYDNFSNWVSKHFDYDVYLNFPLSSSASPFDVAVLGESRDVMEYFIENGLNVNEYVSNNNEGLTYLMLAVIII